MRMLVEFHRRSHGRILTGKLEKRGLDLAAALLGRLYDGFGVYALVNVQGDGGDLERSVLGLAGPDELWIEMGIVLVGPGFAVYIGGGCDQANRRVIKTLLLIMLVLFKGVESGLPGLCHSDHLLGKRHNNYYTYLL